MMKRIVLSLVLTFVLCVPGRAAFQLDGRYEDNDGDLIADIPKDPASQVDPSTLIFAYTPVEDPAVYVDVWKEFLDHLSEVTGKPVQFFPVQSNAAQIEAMRAGRLHVAGVNTGSNPLAVACAGFRPFTMMVSTSSTSRVNSSPSGDRLLRVLPRRSNPTFSAVSRIGRSG